MKHGLLIRWFLIYTGVVLYREIVQKMKLLNEVKSNLKYGQNLTVNLTENRNRVKIKLTKFRNIRKYSEFRVKI